MMTDEERETYKKLCEDINEIVDNCNYPNSLTIQDIFYIIGWKHGGHDVMLTKDIVRKLLLKRRGEFFGAAI